MIVYMAGCSQSDSQPLIQMGQIPYAFYSFYYLRKGNNALKNLIRNQSYHKRIFIDSGAHSFFAGSDHVQAASNQANQNQEDPFQFFEEYIQFLIKNWEFYTNFAELDIGEIVGQEVVMGWRKRLMAAGLWAKCVPVYHPQVMSWQDFISMLETQESGYVALEGDRKDRDRLPYNKLIRECYQRGIKVHGFAMTKQDVMANLPFFSVDSTTWKAGYLFGKSYGFDQDRKEMILFDIYNRPKAERYLVPSDFDACYNGTSTTQAIALGSVTIRAFEQLQIHLTKVWESRGIVW